MTLQCITTIVVNKTFCLLKPKRIDTISMCHLIYTSTLHLISHSHIQLISQLITLLLSHDIDPEIVLKCTLIPLLKDNLSDINSNNDFSEIAGDVLLLKLIDIVVLLLEN